MSQDFVPLCGLPDLRAGDLLLCECTPWVHHQPPILYVIAHNRFVWVGEAINEIENPGYIGWRTIDCDRVFKVLGRLRGVERADILDRWSETERRLRESTDTGGAPVPAKAPYADDPFVQATAALFEPLPAIGDVLTAEQIVALPAGAVVDTVGPDAGRFAWQRHKGNHWRMVLIAPETQAEYDSHLDPPAARTMGEFSTGAAGGRLLGLNTPLGNERTPLLESLAEQGCKPARRSWYVFTHGETQRTEPLPAIGDPVDEATFARLPVGSVCSLESTRLLLVRTNKGDNGWVYGDTTPNTGIAGAAWWGTPGFKPRQTNSRYLGAVPFKSEGVEFCRALANQEYQPALDALAAHYRAETPRTDQDVRKQILDGASAAPQTEDMATTEPVTVSSAPVVDINDNEQLTVSITGVSGAKRGLTQRHGEHAQGFMDRANGMARAVGSDLPFPEQAQAPAVRTPQFVQAPSPTSALAKIGNALQGLGAEFAKDGVKALVDGKALVLVDAGRMGLHRAIVAGVESVGGEAHAVTALRVAQSPWTAILEDVALAAGASLAGKSALAAAVRGRVMRRVVDGVGDAVVAQGAAIVTQLAQAVGAIGAASAAAELPADAEHEGEVQS